MNILTWLANSRKSLVTAVGVALTALTFADTLSFLPASVTGVIGTVIAILTPIATWLTPNKA